MDYDTYRKEQEQRTLWLEANQERLEELSDEHLDRMSMKDLRFYAREALENDWADYPEGFEDEWKAHKESKLPLLI